MNTGFWVMVAIAAGLVVMAGTGVLLVRHVRRRPRARLSSDIEERRADIRRRLSGILVRTPARSALGSSEIPAHPRAAQIEAKLLAGELTGALLAAEDTLIDEPTDPRVYVLLARVLVHCDELGAAARKLVRARRLGASGPMLHYLEARVQQRKLDPDARDPGGRRLGAARAELITPYEAFVLELDRRRGRPKKARELWLSVMHKPATSPGAELADISSHLCKHFAGYYDCLDKLLLAVEGEPAFTDALYHLARMALKAGFRAEGRALMEKIEPLMYASTEKRFYERDISRLRADAARPLSAVLSARAGKVSERRSSTPGMFE